MPFTRRALLAQGGIAAVGLAGLPRPAYVGGRAPAKLVSMAPLTAPGSPQQDYTQAGNRSFFADTRTRVIRISLDWPQVEPTPGAYDWRALDANVAAAKADGLTVILSTYRFPRWTNTTAVDERDAARTPEFRLPSALDAASPFGALMEEVVSRYSRGSATAPNPAAWIDYLEPVNEPNLLYWPQCETGGERTIHIAVAEMLATVQEIRAGARTFGAAMPELLLPAASDILTEARDRRARTPLFSSDPGLDFTALLVGALHSNGFDQSEAFWSHHNYTDVEQQRWGGASITQALRRRLGALGWAGSRRLESRGLPSPVVFLTEGGARVSADPAAQGQRVRMELAALSTATDGEGIATVAQELFYSQIDPRDPSNTFDSGLLEPHAPGTPDRFRPAYADWRALADPGRDLGLGLTPSGLLG